jgi:hypothetical protein
MLSSSEFSSATNDDPASAVSVKNAFIKQQHMYSKLRHGKLPHMKCALELFH